MMITFTCGRNCSATNNVREFKDYSKISSEKCMYELRYTSTMPIIERISMESPSSNIGILKRCNSFTHQYDMDPLAQKQDINFEHGNQRNRILSMAFAEIRSFIREKTSSK